MFIAGVRTSTFDSWSMSMFRMPSGSLGNDFVGLDAVFGSRAKLTETIVLDQTMASNDEHNNFAIMARCRRIIVSPPNMYATACLTNANVMALSGVHLLANHILQYSLGRH